MTWLTKFSRRRLLQDDQDLRKKRRKRTKLLTTAILEDKVDSIKEKMCCKRLSLSRSSSICTASTRLQTEIKLAQICSRRCCNLTQVPGRQLNKCSVIRSSAPQIERTEALVLITNYTNESARGLPWFELRKLY